ncbi:hypothetical protein N7510_008926 [Penicillium lagena]|uniref:uncharacterized protein n=1 Tax=Penicillium lagena TaxID=94218 RepID=UPI002541304C|nr:uncharacterized protein N7510_008926 [Penicillium lagena]KAJ5606145.1 hypothetical protein N7510_008926 [Penicillium lagena]
MADNTPIDIIRSHDSNDLDFEHTSRHGQDHNVQSQTEPQPDGDEDEKDNRALPPDGGYGWVCVACVFWINAHTWGINSSYGVFLSYYLSHDVFPNTSVLAYAFTGGLSISCALLIAPLSTYLIQLCGTRIVLNLGVFFETLSFIGASFASKKWQIFLSQGVCFGFGMGFLFVGSVSIAPQWFLKRRSVAMGITAAGSGLGGLIWSLAVGAMIPRIGLAWTFRVLGIVSCVVNLVCANLLRDRNKAIGSRLTAFHFPLLRRPEFLSFLCWGVFSMLGYVSLLFSMADFALSIGLSSHQASIVSALLNLGQGLGRPFVGMFSDRLGRINIATLLSFCCGFFCLIIWIFADNMGVTCFFAVLVGTVSGTYWATVSPVLAEIIGLRDLPSGLSITWLFLVAPCTVSEPIALELRAHLPGGGSSYQHLQIFTGFAYIGASLFLWIVRGWKVGEQEREERRREAAVQSGPLTEEVGSGEKRDRPATILSTSTSTATTNAQLWAPFGLVRRMVAIKRV